MRSFCRKNHVRKIPLFFGGGFGGGGGSADFIFMGARIFLKNYVTAPEINSPKGPKSPQITVRKSFKSPVRLTVPKNNS